MKTRLIKEWRALGPAWIGAMALAAGLLFYEHAADVEIVEMRLLGLGLGLALLGVAAFGHELSHGTMSYLLTLPLPRSQTWNEKMLALITAALPLVVLSIIRMDSMPVPWFWARLLYLDRIEFLDGLGYQIVVLLSLLGLAISYAAWRVTQAMDSRLRWRFLHRVIPLGICFVTIGTGILGADLAMERLHYHQQIGFICLSAALPLILLVSIPPCLTLATRNSLVSLVLSLLVPPMVFLTAGFIWSMLQAELPPADHDNAAILFSVVSLVICSLIFYMVGRRRFLRWQAVEGASAEAAMPSLATSLLRCLIGQRLKAGTRPIANLIRKEIFLQHGSFMVAGAFGVVLGLAVIVKWACLQALPEGSWVQLEQMADGLLMGILVNFPIVVPIVVGAVSVAQERNWGLTESQLSLPIPARKQWLVKVGVAILTTLLLGSAVPGGIGFALQWVYGQESLQLAGILNWLGWSGVDPDQIPSAFFWSQAVLMQLLLLALAIYASSVSQTALRAAVGAIGIGVAYLGCLAGSPFLAGVLLHINPGLVTDAPNEGLWLSPASLANAPAGLALLFVFLLVLAQIGVVLRFGFANFRRSDWRVCHLTIHALVVVVVICLCTLISRSLLLGT